MKRLLDWLDHRTGYRELLHEALYERIPGGARWRYVWGSTLVFVFFVQVITGICLWMAYSPSDHTAWESVYYIQFQMKFGNIVRGIHHFAAQAMIVLMVFHLVQVIWDGAYKAPREVNFWLGLILMQIVLALGLTGYLLPWDQKGYYATEVATNIMAQTPVIGPSLQQVVLGGAKYGHHTLTRFFALHAGVLPGLLVAFLALHIYVFRRHGITVAKPDRAPEAKFWPDQVLKDAVACLAVLAAILTLTLWKGAELTAPANPAQPFDTARPEWYFLFLFQFLKTSFAVQIGEQAAAIFVPGAIMLVIFLMPFIAKIRGGHWFNVTFLGVLLIGAGWLTWQAIQEDKADPNFQLAQEEVHRDADRVIQLAKVEGIPPQGARTLLRDDPLTQGPRVFNQYCADCHQPEGVKFKNPPLAPSLANFGSREWIRSVLTDFSGHFAPAANFENGEGEGLVNGTMAGWSSTYGSVLTDPANEAAFSDLVEFIYAQSGRPDALAPDDPAVLRGRDIFAKPDGVEGALPIGDGESCIACHSMQPVGEEADLSEGFAPYAPTLTGYGSPDWIKGMVTDPASDTYYGQAGSNAMPAFGEQLSEHQLEMLVRWLTGDYHPAE
jgi:ubiquinol-cytochrome c reductase cytochrome b subunit